MTGAGAGCGARPRPPAERPHSGRLRSARIRAACGAPAFWPPAERPHSGARGIRLRAPVESFLPVNSPKNTLVTPAHKPVLETGLVRTPDGPTAHKPGCALDGKGSAFAAGTPGNGPEGQASARNPRTPFRLPVPPRVPPQACGNGGMTLAGLGSTDPSRIRLGAVPAASGPAAPRRRAGKGGDS
jgi:hypothetical protein